ncbi:uncharacterized protein LOC126796162 [Argentina anserina]|uniref:uncharacterized protein LOC126796162 n=1 Tax=Argentina anserina TaxID=57926 RepID=UPI0021767F4F|nr:uncharacterized protein LOC126796162 [Potentilla anserina]
MSCVGVTAGAKLLLDSGNSRSVNRANRNRFQIGARAQFEFNSSSSPPLLLLLRATSSTRRRHVEMAPMEVTSASAPPSTLLLTSGASGRISALFSLRALRSLVMLVNAFFLLLLLPFRGGRKPSSEKLLPDDDRQQQRGKVVRVPPTIVHWKSTTSSPPPVDHDVAARRALAKLRVRQDEDPNCVRQYSIFNSARGETLFTQTWTPVSVNIRGVVIVMHGLNEHSGRYSTFAKQLNVNGFKVYGMDWIGHGGSDGLHAYVPSLDFAVADLKSYIEKVVAENPGLPCFCFGHSTGGAIIIKAMLDPKVEACIDGVVLTSPAVGVQPSHPIFVVLAPVIAFLLPRYQLSAANKSGMPVSRDPAALAAKYSDPLVYTGAIRVRTGYEILRITSYLQQNLSKMKVPFLVLHGTADTVTDPVASQKLYNEAASADKTITLYDGLLHDLLFEPEREAISKHIIGWLKNRI